MAKTGSDGDRRLTILARAEETELGELLIAEARAKRDKLREKNEMEPEVNDREMTADFRTVNGEIRALNWFLGLFEQAKQEIRGS